MGTINVAVIGYGYWGPNLVRNFFELDECWLSAVCDLRPKNLQSLKKRYPSIKTTVDPDEIFNDPSIHAVAIATPVSTHFELAMKALKAGKHVFVEKPMTVSSDEAVKLIAEAKKRKLILMVDHTFIYTGAVRKIRELVNTDALGEVFYYDSVRISLGLFQHDINVLWDLAVHDIAIMDYVLSMKPKAVSAIGISHVSGKPESIAYLTMLFDKNLIAHIHANWLAPVKVRQTLVSGSRKMVVYDELDPAEKIKVYDKGVNVSTDPKEIYKMQVDYRVGDMWAPHIDMSEALRTEALHFFDCIKTGKNPISDGEAGLRVVRVLEAANRSMKKQGQLVKLSD